jgi:hypothetical protein
MRPSTHDGSFGAFGSAGFASAAFAGGGLGSLSFGAAQSELRFVGVAITV